MFCDLQVLFTADIMKVQSENQTKSKPASGKVCTCKKYSKILYFLYEKLLCCRNELKTKSQLVLNCFYFKFLVIILSFFSISLSCSIL